MKRNQENACLRIRECLRDPRVKPAVRARRELLEDEANRLRSNGIRRRFERIERLDMLLIADEDHMLARGNGEGTFDGATRCIGEGSIGHDAAAYRIM
jgi:hypothetical protein